MSFRTEVRLNLIILLIQDLFIHENVQLVQDQFIGVRWQDSDNDGYPIGMSGVIRQAIVIIQIQKTQILFHLNLAIMDR